MGVKDERKARKEEVFIGKEYEMYIIEGAEDNFVGIQTKQFQFMMKKREVVRTAMMEQ